MSGDWIDAAVESPAERDEQRSDDVLVAFSDGSCGVLFFDHDEGVWSDCYGDAYAGLSEPTHWMPLPELPKAV